jgi:hypothetical protein
MLVKYDYSKEGICTAEEALRRVCNSDLIDSLQHMYEMDGDMLVSTYNNLIQTLHTLGRIKVSIDKGGEVVDNEGHPSTD